MRIRLDMFGCLVVVTIAAVRHFGWLDGPAVVAAIYLMMPWPAQRARQDS